jgi:hypothetical protein
VAAKLGLDVETTADVPPIKSKANTASSNFILSTNLKFIINILSQLTGFITYKII